MCRTFRTALIVGGLAAALAPCLYAANPNPGILPINSKPHGKAYGEWSGLWWQWAYSIPADQNPILDQTGEYAAIGQSGPVWFLAGTPWAAEGEPVQPVERTVTIPTGKALFFPIVNAIWVNVPEFGDDPWSPEQEAFARDLLAGLIDGVTGLTCEIDGRSVKNLDNYRAQTPEGKDYMVTFPEGNVWGIPAGSYGPSVDDGIYLMLAPLSEGRHTIHFVVPGFLEVTYHLKVKSMGNPNPCLLPVHGKAFGKTYGEWAAEWWKWGLAGTIADSPILDETGEFCDVRQSGKVWFLAGTFGSGEFVRTCEVPAGKAIFFPVANALFWAPEDGDTEEEVRAGANAAMDGVDLLECTIDGVPLEALFDQRAESPAFLLPVPEGSILTEFGFPAGDRFPAVADGYWILLAPLSSGEHEIHFRMHIGSGDFAGSEHDVTYNLTVVGGK